MDRLAKRSAEEGDGPDEPGADRLAHNDALRRRLAAQDVDDYVQEVYARAVGAAPASKVRNLGGFLVRIASNLVLDQRRRARVRHAGRSVPIEDVPEHGDDGALQLLTAASPGGRRRPPVPSVTFGLYGTTSKVSAAVNERCGPPSASGPTR